MSFYEFYGSKNKINYVKITRYQTSNTCFNKRVS